MKLIAQQRLPELDHLLKCNPINQANCPAGQAVPKIPGIDDFPTLGNFLTRILDVAFYLAVFLAFYWLVWGAFQYITAGGNKEKLAQARARITWAIVGLLITAIAFALSQFAAQILPPATGIPII